jgi:cytochrome c oxidase subunit II
MKKLGLFILAGALSVGLAACGGADEETSSSTQEETEQTAAAPEETSGSTQAETAETTTASDAEEFTITATNWKFNADKELTIKKGTNVKINLVNEEGVHTITNEELGIDLSVGEPVEFTADKPGEYDLICSTICGAIEDHEGMKLSLKVID